MPVAREEEGMTSQKTVERCRKERDDLKAEVETLRDANQTLLNNNVILAKENAAMWDKLQSQIRINTEIEGERAQCAQKCRIALSEKDRILQEKERRLANCKPTFQHLKDAKWFYRLNQLPDGQVEIIHTVKFA